jgi:hypothetical protein
MIFKPSSAAIAMDKRRMSLCIGKSGHRIASTESRSLLASGTVEERMYKKQVRWVFLFQTDSCSLR